MTSRDAEIKAELYTFAYAYEPSSTPDNDKTLKALFHKIEYALSIYELGVEKIVDLECATLAMDTLVDEYVADQSYMDGPGDEAVTAEAQHTLRFLQGMSPDGWIFLVGLNADLTKRPANAREPMLQQLRQLIAGETQRFDQSPAPHVAAAAVPPLAIHNDLTELSVDKIILELVADQTATINDLVKDVTRRRPTIKHATVRSRIYALVSRRKIVRVGHGTYELANSS